MTDVPGPAPEPADGAASREVEAQLRTFLIADIRGYTVYTQEHGADAAADLAGRFAAIVREVVTAHDGFLIELRGDEALAVFVLARRALRASLELQGRFAAELPRGVGIGLDAGEAIPVEGGYRGSALNLAARLCSQAGPGETLASEAVIHLAAKVEGVGYADPRTYHLKGIEQPIRAVHVVAAAFGSKKPIRYGSERQLLANRGLLAVGIVGLAVIALVAAALSGAFGGKGSALPSPGVAAATATPAATPERIAVADLPVLAYVDPVSGEITDSRHTESQMWSSQLIDGQYWLFGFDPSTMLRVDAATHQTLQTVPLPVSAVGNAVVADGVIWVSDLLTPRVLGIDAATGIQIHEYDVESNPDGTSRAGGMTAGAGSLWLGSFDPAEVVRIDPASGEVQARIPDVYADVLAYDGTAIYATGSGTLTRIDPATNTATWVTKLADTYLGDIAFGAGFTWTADGSSGTVWKVDRTGYIVGTFQTGVGALPLAPLGDTMWVGVQDAGKLVGIEMVTGATREIPVGHLIYGIDAGADELIVTVGQTPEELIGGIDGDVLTIAAPYEPFFVPNPDPAVNRSFEGRQAGFITCAGLLRYPDAPAPDGWTLEPEVAATMPEVSEDGRTYAFAVRTGFAFSPPSNQPITAETYRQTLERALSAGLGEYAPGIAFLGDVVGAVDFHEGRADHVSGIVVEGDQLRMTLEAAAPDFLQRLTLPYFCPVPLGTPAVPEGLDAVPPLAAAGPYYMSRHIAGELGIFLRNPNYHGSRPQPFAAIAFRVGFEPGDAIGRVEAGLADAATAGAFDSLLNAASDRAKRWGPGSAAAAAGDQRWFGGPRFGGNFLALNPRDPLLADIDVRRAISLALDRSALAVTLSEAPAPGLIPPSAPGSAPIGAPVPAPDLDAARALMAGRTGTLVMATQPDCGFCDALAHAVAGQLVAIGITVKIEEFDDPVATAQEPGTPIDLLDGFQDTDFGDPITLLDSLHEQAWLPKTELAFLDAALGLGGQPRIDAAVALSTRLVDEEYLIVPIGYPVYPLYLGNTVGCGFVQPAIGAVDLLSLCRKP